MRIAMIGTGYVGLVSAACLAEFGFSVSCADKNPAIVARLQAGETTIFEPGLEHLVTRNRKQGRLRFSDNLADCVRDADVVFLAVGTPSRPGDGVADLQYIETAADEVAAVMKPGAVIVIKSTVAVGTNAQIRERIRARRPGVDFSIASNPEFLREGSAIEDFMRPDRVVVGVEDARGREIMRAIYQPLASQGTPLLITSLENAELIKYAANAFLAVKVTFINQVADLCEKVGGNVQEVAQAIGLDQRIGGRFLNAGPGFGGSCFPKDMRAFAATGKHYDAPQQLVENVIAINEQRKQDMAARVIAAINESGLQTVAILGVTFKPDTDDIRESPALDIIATVAKAGFAVRAHDPQGMVSAAAVLPGVQWCNSPYEAAEQAGVCVIMTEWNAYRDLDLKKLGAVMAGNVLIDFRNIYKAEDLAGSGLDYRSVGRPLVK